MSKLTGSLFAVDKKFLYVDIAGRVIFVYYAGGKPVGFYENVSKVELYVDGTHQADIEVGKIHGVKKITRRGLVVHVSKGRIQK